MVTLSLGTLDIFLPEGCAFDSVFFVECVPLASRRARMCRDERVQQQDSKVHTRGVRTTPGIASMQAAIRSEDESRKP